jgi:hypothetical protein
MALTQVSSGLIDSTAQYTGFKNRIINGAMMISQRNGSSSISISNPGVYTVDRFKSENNTDGTLTAQQSSTAPAGFINSLLFTVGTADSSLASTQYAIYEQRVEGLNITDFGWGTASAQPVTLSFWVRASVTGTYGGSIVNNDFNRTYPFTYVISAANTWEQKSITIAGDTSGTWLTTNGIGLVIRWGFGVGSTYSAAAGSWAAGGYLSANSVTNMMATSGATYYITGVMLEKGSTATSYDYRPYGTELQLCYRYFAKFSAPCLRGIAKGSTTGSGDRMGMVLPVPMRAAPTSTQSGLALFDGSTAVNVTAIAASYSTSQVLEFDLNSDGSGMVTGRACVQYQAGSLSCSAEL